MVVFSQAVVYKWQPVAVAGFCLQAQVPSPPLPRLLPPPPFKFSTRWPAVHVPQLLLPSMSFLSPPVYSSASMGLIRCVPFVFLSSFSYVLYLVITAGCNQCVSCLVMLPFTFRVLCASHSSLVFCLLMPHQMVIFHHCQADKNHLIVSFPHLHGYLPSLALACTFFSTAFSVLRETDVDNPVTNAAVCDFELSLCPTPPNWQVLPTISHDMVWCSLHSCAH